MAARPSVRVPPPDVLKVLPAAALAGLACECAAVGDIEGMRTLVKVGADVSLGIPYDQRTPLHVAAAAGNLEMVRFLVEQAGARLQRDRFGLLPVHDAVESGRPEVRRYLQGRRLSEEVSAASRPPPATQRGGRERAGSAGEASSMMPEQTVEADEMMSTVFELIVKEGVFSYATVHAEVQHFFRGLGLHPAYFEHFTPLQIAKHIHCLIAAKRIARATDHVETMRFDFVADRGGFFLATIDSGQPTKAQKRTEEKVAQYLEQTALGTQNVSLTFMSSEGPAIPHGKERLGIWVTERDFFELTHPSEDETSIEVLGSTRFLKRKTTTAKEQYQMLMEDVVASRRCVVRIANPGRSVGGYVLFFGTSEVSKSYFFPELCAAMRFMGFAPRRFYVETFANGVVTYSMFFPSAKEEDLRQLERIILYSTMLKSFPGKSELIFKSVMQARISHEVGLYLLAAVKFVYAFFPKERYARQYIDLQKLLDQDPSSKRKLEDMYRLCMKELLPTGRIYELLQRNPGIGQRLFEDFRFIALGERKPWYNEALGAEIDASCPEAQDRQILRIVLTFNQGLLLTNFFKARLSGAIAFRLDPEVVLKDRPVSMYPEMPYGIYMVVGKDFWGFHVRFRDVARGGVRLIFSPDLQDYDRNQATLFDACYNLALTQQLKNKDIPEGGARGVILPDSSWGNVKTGNVLAGASSQSPASARSCFTRYLGALLDCMLPERFGIYSGHLRISPELLYFGPDDNTHEMMDLGAGLAQIRGHPHWKALVTGKSVKFGGVPHDEYGMCTASVRTYVQELLAELKLDEERVTKVQIGGPSGELGSSEILQSKDKTIAVVDASGVLYDPSGLSRVELCRLARRRTLVQEFSRSFLGPGGFLINKDDVDVVLPDGSKWRTGAELRDAFHFTDYATADIFMPCEGRPNTVTSVNVKKMIRDHGKPKFRIVVEAADMFFSETACAMLEHVGVHVFKDASTMKGAVNSSSLEVLAALALPSEDHAALMCYTAEAGSEPPVFYGKYVQQILETIVQNARLEFRAIWKCNRRDGLPKVEATRRLSMHINHVKDSFESHFSMMSDAERGKLVRNVLTCAVPQIMLDRLGVEGIVRRVPTNYVLSMVGAWIASRYVYCHGLDASEVSFFVFMRELLSADASAVAIAALEARRASAPFGGGSTLAAAPGGAASGADDALAPVEGGYKKQKRSLLNPGLPAAARARSSSTAM